MLQMVQAFNEWWISRNEVTKKVIHWRNTDSNLDFFNKFIVITTIYIYLGF